MSYLAIEHMQTFGRSRALLAQIGDSRLANGKTISGADLFRYMHGVGSQVAVLCNGKVKAPLSYNKAVSGSTILSYVGDGGASAKGIIPSDGSAGQLAEILALNPLPTHVLILDGTNGIAQGLTTAQMLAGYQTVWATLLQAGIVPLQLLDLPREWTTDASRKKHMGLNVALMIQGPKAGAVILDATGDLANIANSNGDPVAALYYDSPAIHPGNSGCYPPAVKVASYFNSLPLMPGYHGWSRGDVYEATNNPGGNLLPGSGLNGSTGGALSGTNVSGTVANGMKLELVSGSVTSAVGSLEARADGGAGQWQKIVITAAGASQTWFYPNSDITVAGGNIAVADVLEYGFDFEISGTTGVSNVAGRLIDYNGGSALATYWPMIWDATKGVLPASISGRAEMDPMTLLASTTRVVPIISISTTAAATVTVKIGASSLRKPQ